MEGRVGVRVLEDAGAKCAIVANEEADDGTGEQSVIEVRQAKELAVGVWTVQKVNDNILRAEVRQKNLLVSKTPD
ncbi:PTS N-acetylgalactosamine transporter subunit IIB, partial [Escherichia coli]|nr:PTS N-acetylgalactosamine transporter subunit IIB [Escherichia coli]